MANGKTQFDFAALRPETAELPRSARGREAGPNPLLALVQESWDAYDDGKDAGRKLTIPTSEAVRAIYLLRRAAGELGIGISTPMTDAKGNRLYVKSEGGVMKNNRRSGGTVFIAKEDGTKFGGNVVTLYYEAQEKRERRANDDDDETSDDTANDGEFVSDQEYEESTNANA